MFVELVILALLPFAEPLQSLPGGRAGAQIRVGKHVENRVENRDADAFDGDAGGQMGVAASHWRWHRRSTARLRQAQVKGGVFVASAESSGALRLRGVYRVKRAACGLGCAPWKLIRLTLLNH